MFKKRLVWILGLALFSLFFGAGNLILPPQIGFLAGPEWWLVGLGFTISAVLIPMLGILAHARLQGTMFDFAKKASPALSLVYCYLIYGIALGLPAPRTASVTHEMAIAPFFNLPPVATSLGYFGLVLLFVINRSKVSSLIGKWLTPVILAVLLLLIGSITLYHGGALGPSTFENSVSAGILEGYQTFDAIGAVVIGGVILISLNLEAPGLDFKERFRTIAGAGFLAALALMLLYAGLIYSGALMFGEAEAGITRTGLLRALSVRALGPGGQVFLSILIGLACFTTAVGIVTGASDFIKDRFGGSQKAYLVTAILGCLAGVVMGQLPVGLIIAVALPVLMLVYPLTIVLIFMNVIPPTWAPAFAMRVVCGVTLLFSLPDFLGSLGLWEGGNLPPALSAIPLAGYQMGWLLPALVAFGLTHLWFAVRPKASMEQGT
ncbi:branched-chain amino acid transport system II carrier protein [Robiginitalea sediminis]|uniref:branched-chain amino acid transport system II carrier protein n=1 Tax=Robiginitalea sediminis TaxID=1982593 RepID=UPI000B4A6156|nr:branched-chain amino acid transport system II carrier protein [Robiginitalea sediminis]